MTEARKTVGFACLPKVAPVAFVPRQATLWQPMAAAQTSTPAIGTEGPGRPKYQHGEQF